MQLPLFPIDPSRLRLTHHGQRQRQTAPTSLFRRPPRPEMGVLAGLTLEGPASGKWDLLAQQSAALGAGLVLAGEVRAFASGVMFAVGRFPASCPPLGDWTGAKGDGVKL